MNIDELIENSVRSAVRDCLAELPKTQGKMYFNVREAAEQMGVSTQTVRGWHGRYELGAKVDSIIIISAKDMDEFYQGRKK